ncbi:response regulator [Sphingomonas sp. CJ99]
MTAPILIIDDEPAIRRLLRGALERGGWRVDEAADAESGLVSARRPGCQLVILDLGLPDRDGIELVPLLKAADRAVIVLTARDATAEKVTALDLGADDYVTKPFDTQELLARVRAALRHRTSRSSERIEAGELTIDLAGHLVTRHGQPVALTRKEFALLVELSRHAGRVLTHAALLRAVWGDAHVDDIEYLRVAIRSLRQKLEGDPSRPRLIVNEPGVGYRLAA